MSTNNNPNDPNFAIPENPDIVERIIKRGVVNNNIEYLKKLFESETFCNNVDDDFKKDLFKVNGNKQVDFCFIKNAIKGFMIYSIRKNNKHIYIHLLCSEKRSLCGTTLLQNLINRIQKNDYPGCETIKLEPTDDAISYYTTKFNFIKDPNNTNKKYYIKDIPIISDDENMMVGPVPTEAPSGGKINKKHKIKKNKSKKKLNKRTKKSNKKVKKKTKKRKRKSY